MEFRWCRKPDHERQDEVVLFRGELRIKELASIRLNGLERAILKDLEAPADCLLALEMIFRRYAEQNPSANNKVRSYYGEIAQRNERPVARATRKD